MQRLAVSKQKCFIVSIIFILIKYFFRNYKDFNVTFLKDDAFLGFVDMPNVTIIKPAHAPGETPKEPIIEYPE